VGAIAAASIPAIAIWVVSSLLAQATGAAPGEIDIARGKKLFLSRCANCHSIDARPGTRLGPSLRELGQVAADRKPGLSGPAYILESILDPAAFRRAGVLGQMPINVVADLSDKEIRGLVGFLCTLGATPDWQQVARLTIKRNSVGASSQALDISLERMDLGTSVYFGKGQCAACHGRFPLVEYQVRAPAIFSAGLKDRESVYRSIVDPHHDVASFYREAQIVMADGRVVTGRIVHQDAEKIELLTQSPGGSSSELQSIPLGQIEQDQGAPLIEIVEQSVMPEGYAKLLTDDELNALVDLITILN